MKHNQQGYILFTAFVLLSLCSVMLMFFLAKGSLFRALSSLVIERNKTNQTISAMTIAQSYLMVIPEKSAEKKAVDSSEKEDNAALALLKKVYPYQQRTKKFVLKKEIDGFDGSIELLFTSEAGKINLNALYNFKDKKFYGEGTATDRKKLATWLFEKIASLTQTTSLFAPFEKHCNERKAPFNDVLELLQIPEFQKVFAYKVFKPVPEKKPSLDMILPEEKAKELYLMDLFTVTSMTQGLDAWLLSSSVQTLCDMPQKQNDEKSLDEEKLKSFYAKFKDSVEWANEWDTILQPVYGITYSQIPAEIKGILTLTFWPHIFSIVACTTRDEKKSMIQVIVKQKTTKNNALMYDSIKIYQL